MRPLCNNSTQQPNVGQRQVQGHGEHAVRPPDFHHFQPPRNIMGVFKDKSTCLFLEPFKLENFPVVLWSPPSPWLPPIQFTSDTEIIRTLTIPNDQPAGCEPYKQLDVDQPHEDPGLRQDPGHLSARESLPQAPVVPEVKTAPITSHTEAQLHPHHILVPDELAPPQQLCIAEGGAPFQDAGGPPLPTRPCPPVHSLQLNPSLWAKLAPALHLLALLVAHLHPLLWVLFFTPASKLQPWLAGVSSQGKNPTQ